MTDKKKEHDEVRNSIDSGWHVDCILSNVKAIQALHTELSPHELTRLRIATETHFKLLAKVLPDVKSIEAPEAEVSHVLRLEDMSIEDLQEMLNESE